MQATAERQNLGVPIRFRAQPDLLEALRDIALREDRSVSNVIRRAVRDYVNAINEEKQRA
jgi:hypothetical protein